VGKKRNNKPDPAAEQTYKKINVALLIGAVILAAGIVWYVMRPAPPMAADIANLPRPDIETLDPSQFNGQTRLAYQAAKEIPAILSQLPCYCGCMSNFGHKNNLYCFRDSHGVECSMCQDIALDALQMARAGQSLERILEHTRTKFGRVASANHDH
jgi:hypothetical protein